MEEQQPSPIDSVTLVPQQVAQMLSEYGPWAVVGVMFLVCLYFKKRA